MTKIITTTFLLKNPAKVRAMVKQGIELLVKFEGEIVMKIIIPTENKTKNQGKFPPAFKSNFQYDKNVTFSREDLYNGKYD